MKTRYDTAPISQLTTDAQTGYLHAANVPIARVGVFPYLKMDGSIDMEAKLPQELLSDATVESANNKAITNDHPKELVTSSNSEKYLKGFTADNAHVQNNTLRVDMTITDGDLIKAINDGKQELSIGFQTDVVPKTGEYQGSAYDAVQKNIQINHVAVVKRGRAGHNVRITGDSAEMILDKDKEGKSMELTKVRLDGSDVKVDPNDADKVSQANSNNDSKDKEIADLKAQIKDLKAKLAEATGNANNSKQETTSSKQEIDKQKAKADALDKEFTDYKKKYNRDVFDQKVQDRIDLTKTIKPLLGDSYEFKGKSDKDLKVAAIKKILGDSFDAKGKSDDFINGQFEMIKNNKPGAVGYGGMHRVKGDSDEDEAISLRDQRYRLANILNKQIKEV